jgi:hypothetical protein
VLTTSSGYRGRGILTTGTREGVLFDLNGQQFARGNGFLNYDRPAGISLLRSKKADVECMEVSYFVNEKLRRVRDITGIRTVLGCRVAVRLLRNL